MVHSVNKQSIYIKIIFFNPLSKSELKVSDVFSSIPSSSSTCILSSSTLYCF